MRLLDQTLHTAANAVLRESLSEGAHQIKFYKADDSVRVMNVTLNGELITEALGEQKQDDVVLTEEEVLASYAKTNISVLDVDAKAWKSFKVEKLFEIDGEHPASLIKRYMHRALGAKEDTVELTSGATNA